MSCQSDVFIQSIEVLVDNVFLHESFESQDSNWSDLVSCLVSHPFIVGFFTFLCLGFLLTESVSDAMQFSRFVSSMLGRFKFTVLTPFLFLCYSRKIMEPDVPHSLRLQSILIGRTISSNPPTTRSRWSSPRLPKTTTIPPR